MENDKIGLKVEVLNWGMTKFGCFGQELSEVDWGRLVARKGKSGKWNASKYEVARAKAHYVPVRQGWQK